MRCLLQRVTSANVSVDGTTVGQTGPGLMILACAMQGDTDANAEALARKVVNIRIFRDENGKTNRSILDTGGSALIVSQFTLAADTTRGNRPGFSAAAAPDEGLRLFNLLCKKITEHGVAVETGQFGAEMQVTLTNDGPFTVWLEK
ncbi:MAG: D-tyrosyl-tRNA(Tyr) deacylase [Rhodobacteraceae bacterium]|nr:D-tyrosyl-tRNA(Tyr) deacylase [Paracoccaceae bacterium]